MSQDSLASHPSAFVSYSWDSDQHKAWVHDLCKHLRSDGVDVKLDQWETVPGDQLPEFMEASIRNNDFVLVVCTPGYKMKSDSRQGGVGYEGDIMTSEVLVGRRNRKFIPILREATWTDSAPTWIAGSFYVDLRGDPYKEDQYELLLDTLHGRRPQPPHLGPSPPARLVEHVEEEPRAPQSVQEVLDARKAFSVEVIDFDARQEHGIEFPYSDYVRLRISNNSGYVLPYLTVQTVRFDGGGKRVGSSRAPSIKTSNIRPGEAFETDYFPRGHLPGVAEIRVEIEHVIDDKNMRFFKELKPFLSDDVSA